MKNKIPADKKEEKTANKTASRKSMIWKIVAISIVIIFILIVAGGLLKVHNTRESFAEATPEQKTSAESAVQLDLESRGLNESEYSIAAARNVMHIRESGEDRNILQVFADSNASRHSYLIDTDSGMIMLHSQTEAYGWMAEMHRKNMCPGCKGVPRGSGEPGRPGTGSCGEENEEGCKHQREMPGPVTGMPWIFGEHRNR
ncbi:hypothetical protein KY359_01525 [Candidatus Woesearchaeota archaeon]|nr:hypothetical protein [Candidatus Woesearchaeota archaeon]